MPPDGDWHIWLFLGGRGSGKTRAGAQWIAEGIARGRYSRVALIGATHNDARQVMIEGGLRQWRHAAKIHRCRHRRGERVRRHHGATSRPIEWSLIVIILQYIAVALAALDEILKAGGNAANLIAQLQATIRALQAENGDPSEDEWKAMNAQITAALDALA